MNTKASCPRIRPDPRNPEVVIHEEPLIGVVVEVAVAVVVVVFVIVTGGTFKIFSGLCARQAPMITNYPGLPCFRQHQIQAMCECE